MEAISDPHSAPAGSQEPKLLDQVYDLARAKGHSESTATNFMTWWRGFQVIKMMT